MVNSTKRKHVTTACVPCRESKVKCDGATPVCRKCEAKGRDCKYSQGEDKRKVSLRTTVEILSARVDQLSRYIQQNGLPVPEMDQETAASLKQISEVLHLPSTVADSPPQQPLAQPGIENVPPITTGSINQFPSPEFDWDFFDIETWNPSFATQAFGHGHNDPFMDMPPIPEASNQIPPRQIHHQSPADLPKGERNPGLTQDEGSHSDDDSEDEVVKQLSHRLGSLQLAQDGQLRYYGPTSNLNLTDFPSTDPNTTKRTLRSDAQETMEHAGVGKPPDPLIEEHLISLYFAWQDPCFHVVDEEMYQKGKDRWRSGEDNVPYYSEVLTNAICAQGAAFDSRYHPHFITWPKSLAEYFADRAKALLDIEMDSPGIATVQALVILSTHEAACKRDARGWLYSGMALRLAYDLGLHVDMASYVAQGKISKEEAEVRRTTFWGTYIVDHISGFYYGRPLRINSENISVRKPAADPKLCRVTTWMPYGLSQNPAPGLQAPLEQVTSEWVHLCDMVSPTALLLFGCSDISVEALQELTEHTTDRMFAWTDSLAPGLRVELDDTATPYLPHVLMLHMLYYQFLIYVHRPYLAKKYVQPSPPRGAGPAHARMTCIDSANSIVKLLRLYEQRYTFRRMNIQAVSIIFTAALILIFVICSRKPGDPPDDAPSHLSTCFRALEDLAQSYDSARRTREVLVAVQNTWQNKSRAHANARRKRALRDRDRTPTDESSSKRPRSATAASEGNFSDQFASPDYLGNDLPSLLFPGGFS